MTKNTGHWREFADAKGIDAKYAEHQGDADRELGDAVVTPKGNSLVAVDDVNMKNPRGEFQNPSSMQGAGKGRGTEKPIEPEGQQGGTVRHWESWARSK
jgi:hypothetical protein